MVDPHSKKNITHQETEEKQLIGIKILGKQWATVAESLQRQQNVLLKSAHDLRNRVTAILGFCSLLQNDDSNPLSEKQKDYIKDILTNTHQVLNSVDKISHSELQKSQFIAIENSIRQLKKYK